MKIRLVQAAAVFAGALAPWMAAADPLSSRLVTEQAQSVRLLKAPGDSLRFRWAARVGEPGHFVLQRPDGTEVWTAAVVGRTAYQAAPPALSGEYELRYRDASGRERVLAHVLVACVSVDRNMPASVVARALPPDALTSASHGTTLLAGEGDVIDSIDRRPTGLLRPPPTPPPRTHA
jgi:hypothetical protein